MPSVFLTRYPLGWRLLLPRRRTPDRGDALFIGPAGVFAPEHTQDPDPGSHAASSAARPGGEGAPPELAPRSAREPAAVARPAAEALADTPLSGDRSHAGATARLVSIAAANAGGHGRSTGALLHFDERTLDRLVRTDSPRLRRAEAARVAEAAARRLPDHDLVAIDEDTSSTETSPLFDEDTVRGAARDRAVSGAFVSRIAFLDSRQTDLVEGIHSGPARISGPAGTGKTVVALHRLARMARRSSDRLLFTTFVRSPPAVHQRSCQRLAPEVADRVEFVGLHRWTRGLLAERGRPLTVDRRAVRNCFASAWRRHRTEDLQALTPYDYWRTEIDRVIKGRGLTSFAQYRGVHRRGRRVALTVDQRALVWALYERYQHNLRDRGVYDDNDLLAAPHEEIRRRPPGRSYSAVVVDEVPDVVLLRLRLLHGLVDDRPDGLLRVGDGQQQVHPGGWPLSDAGIPVRGRGEILRTDYRNSAEIIRYARRLDAVDQVDDLDGAAGIALRDAVVAHPGGRVDQWTGSDEDFDAGLVAAVRAVPVDETGDVAVLATTNAETRRMFRAPADAGVAVSRLDDHDGAQTGTVKVGTVLRAKGLEFSAVFRALITVGDVGLDDGVRRERAEQATRQRLVAATRARDRLWVGRVTAGKGPGSS